MKQWYILLGCGLTLLATGIVFFRQAPHPTTSETPSSTTYREYLFDSGEDRDLGFTKRALQKLQTTTSLLNAGSNIVEFPNLKVLEQKNEDYTRGVFYQATWNDDRYELHRDSRREIPKGTYRMTKNGQPLFEAVMDVGADGPMVDERLIEGKPAFTFLSNCYADETNAVQCDTDVWYDGAFMSQKFQVQHPKFLFVSAGQIGFVASDQGQDKIFYHGSFVTPGFDTIWTHNCCSYTEILPTLYTNGTLLFHAKRKEKTYLAEVQLSPFARSAATR